MDVDVLWTTILGEIELEISHGNFVSFFLGTRITYAPRDNKVIVFCPNPASSFMLQTRFSTIVKNHLEKKLSQALQIEFRIATRTIPNEEVGPLYASVANLENNIRENGLNPNYTFDNFAVSETNQMAFAAAQAVASKPGSAYNPLFLWGPTGVGKTHLAQAIGRQVLVKNRDAKLIYCTGEEFTNEIIEAIRTRTTAQFKRRYRSITMFVADDIQFIAGRESVQMEFFHTFNSILNGGGQIILTSDKPPTEISKLEARLRSRFEGGLLIDVGAPNFELRTAILLTKARERGITLSADTAQQLAANIEDVRALEGALLRYMSEQEHEYDTDKIVARLIKGIPLSEKKKVSPHKIIDTVAGHYDIKASQLLGKSRKRQVVEPRQILMFILRQELGLPFEEIGTLIGGRDHTTVMYGVEKIQTLLPKHEVFRKNVSQIRRLLGE